MGVPSIPEQYAIARVQCPALLAYVAQLECEVQRLKAQLDEEETIMQLRREVAAEVLTKGVSRKNE